MFKTQICSIACVALLNATAFCGPFDASKVAADAKWVIHLDVDAFRKSKVGNHLMEKFVQPKLDENEQIKQLNLSINLTNISGLTAYGAAVEKHADGVLFLTTSADAKKDLDTLVGMAALSENEQKDVVMVQQKPFALYSFKDQVYLAPGAGGVLIAKSRDMLESAREVALGKSESLRKSDSFKDYPVMNEKAFFMVMAEGFNDLAGIPPQAQVLRETKGGRVLLGEQDENLFLNVLFQAKDEEASTKIQQVFQGILALVSLSQPDKEITQLAASTKVASAGRNVSVDLKIPTAKAIETITEKHGGNGKQKSRTKRVKPQPQPEDEKEQKPEAAEKAN